MFRAPCGPNSRQRARLGTPTELPGGDSSLDTKNSEKCFLRVHVLQGCSAMFLGHVSNAVPSR
jgi:hypothetical protein